MHQVVFKYRPVQWLPYQKEIKTTHPERWEELNQHQFEEVVEYLNTEEKTETAVVSLANALLSLESPMLNFPPEIMMLPTFLNEDKYFSCWIIKSLKGLTGPKDQFKNVSIGQFAFADTFFIQYMRDASTSVLDKLIGTLYINEKFNPDRIELHTNEMATLPDETKAAILFNYSVMRMWIMEKYPYIFPKPAEETSDQEPGTSNQEKKPHSSWREFIRNLVNGDYVNEEKILDTLMHTVLYDHNQSIKQQKNKKK